MIPLTTHGVDVTLARVSIAADARPGIAQDSYAMVDKVTNVSRNKPPTEDGPGHASQMVEVERALLVFLGIAG